MTEHTSRTGQTAYRLGTGAPVTIESARAIWAAVTRELLEAVPAGTALSQADLARQVQQHSGVYTRMTADEWLPAVLADLDSDLVSRLRADPPPAVTRARSSAPRRPRADPAPRKRQDAPPAICPTCFMQLPASGRCDTCG